MFASKVIEVKSHRNYLIQNISFFIILSCNKIFQTKIIAEITIQILEHFHERVFLHYKAYNVKTFKGIEFFYLNQIVFA